MMNKNDPESRSDYHETPNIDSLAKSGMRFSQGYSTGAICTPTRRSLLFGQTQLRQGPDQGFAKRYDPHKKGYLTIPLLLKSINSNYKTAHFGKWHQKTDPFSPEDFGYDQSDGRTSNGNGNMYEYKEDKWKNVFITGDPKRSDHLSKRGSSFIRRNAEAGVPFFLQLSYYATHVDIQAKQKTFKHFSNKPRGRVHDHPGYAAMLNDLDSAIGMILEQVKASEIDDNTYIFLLSDNGGVEFIPPSSFKLSPPGINGRKQRNAPLRGGKWVLYEGGIRVPFLVSGPGIKPESQSDTPVVAYDILPTIAELAGYKNKLPDYIDGGSFARVLTGDKSTVARPENAIYHHRNAKSYLHSAVRVGDYKLIKFWKDNYAWKAKTELYNLANDMGETTDLAQAMPEKRKELEQILMRYLKKAQAPLLEDL